MSRMLTITVAAVTLNAAITASAQRATTVQLPTFSFFTVNTTVMVPDGGSAYLGGVGRASSGSTSRGLPGLGGSPLGGNRAIAGSVSAGGISISAKIHDFEAMDQALLNQGLASQPNAAQIFAASKGNGVGRNVTQSVAEIQQEQESAALSQKEEARDCYEKGVAAYEKGKFGAAKIYLQMAVRRADGDLLALAQAKLKAVIEQSRPPQLTAQRER